MDQRARWEVPRRQKNIQRQLQPVLKDNQINEYSNMSG
jgi:hypothetical protein